VPLRVIGDMDEQPANGCRHALASNVARLFEVGRIHLPHPIGGSLQSVRKNLKALGSGTRRTALSRLGLKLLFR
jgi:hypothetical protein